MDKGTQVLLHKNVPITSYKWVNLAGGSFNIGMNLADTEEDRAFPDPNLNSEDLVRGTLNEDLSPKRDTSARQLQEGRSPHSPTSPSTGWFLKCQRQQGQGLSSLPAWCRNGDLCEGRSTRRFAACHPSLCDCLLDRRSHRHVS